MTDVLENKFIFNSKHLAVKNNLQNTETEILIDLLLWCVILCVCVWVISAQQRLSPPGLKNLL